MGDLYWSVERRGFYRGDGLRVPSVSKILAVHFPIPPYIKPWYLERGTAAHAATVEIDAGTFDWSRLDESAEDRSVRDPYGIGPYCYAYRRFLDLMSGLSIEASEKRVCHPSGRWQGRIDRVLVLPDPSGRRRPAVVDIKLGTVQLRYWLQVAGYTKAFAPDDWKGFGRALLILGKDGWPNLTFDPDPDAHAQRWDAEVDSWWKEAEDGKQTGVGAMDRTGP